ncbi:MAG: right-handed parallel beta-helix repeat-containing protein [Candidatus Thorarchaeota archaeon]
MKHAKKALVFLFLLVAPLLLAGVLPTAINNEVEATSSPITTKISVPSYEEQTPILAYNDFDMDNYASALEWEGDGSPDTPYIIEGYNITTDSDSILIHDTTRAFEIRDCLITSFSSGAGNGIMINNATQAAIVDTVVMDKSDTIDVRNVPSLYIENCTIYDGGSSVFIYNCSGATIAECDIYDNFDSGIYLELCNNSMISNNEINSTVVGAGIYLGSSHYVTIIGNHIFDCAASGVWAVLSPHATIENNIIHNNMFFTGPMCGIHLENSPYASIIGNAIYDNARNGIFVEASDWVYIFDNEIYGNSDHGIDVMFSLEGTILQNNIHGNGYWPVVMNALCGIYLGPAINFTISDNMIWNNTPSGISMEGSESIEIINNDIFNNTDTGVFAAGSGSEDLVIFNNRIHGNGYDIGSPLGGAGILTYGYDNSLVENNLVYSNFDYGISVEGDYNKIIGNEVHDSETGIGTEECYFNLVSENTVYNCLGGILVVNVGTNVTSNIVYDNEYGIYMEQSGDCLIYGNDVGWNTVNARETNTFEGQPLIWDDNVSIGNHWHDYDGGGIYWIWNSTHGVTPDRFPSISLNVSQAASVDFEILETGNVVEWDAYALNPSHYEVFVDNTSVLVEDWDGGNIEYLVDGLPHGTHTIGVEVFHISGHSMENGTTADVEDLTAPSDIEGPIHITITVGDNVTAQYSAEDPSGLGQWDVNDTVNFVIDSSGLLTSITDLPVGEYTILVEVSDTHGHTTFLEVTITVSAGVGLPTTMTIAVIVGGAIAAIIVVVVILKKRGT